MSRRKKDSDWDKSDIAAVVLIVVMAIIAVVGIVFAVKIWTSDLPLWLKFMLLK